MNKAILIIINLLGGICMLLGLAVPFVADASEVAQLVLAIYFLIGGFVVWYVSAKRLEGNQ